MLITNLVQFYTVASYCSYFHKIILPYTVGSKYQSFGHDSDVVAKYSFGDLGIVCGKYLEKTIHMHMQ